MASSSGRNTPGPDIWAVGAGWLALVLFFFTINLWAWMGSWGDVWVIRGAIVTAACFLTWLFGYWSRILVATKIWVHKGGLNATMVAVGVLVVAIGVNYMFHRYHWQKDLTKNQRLTLSDRTTQILKGLNKPLQVTAFYSQVGRNRGTAEGLLRQYHDASPNFKYQLLDPLRDALLALQKGLKTQEGIIFEYGGRTEQTAAVGEKEWTTAILKLTRDKQPKVYFLQGHGEMNYESSGDDPRRSLSMVSQMLTDAQWVMEKLYLQGKDVKPLDPTDAALVVVADPEKPLPAEEIKRLNEYLAKGGRVLILTSPGGPDLSAIAKPYGIDIGTDIVIDPGSGDQLLVRQPESTEVTRRLGIMVFLSARSVSPTTKPEAGVSPQSLVKSDDKSKSIPNFKKATQPNLAAPDAKAGPISLAVLSTKSASGPGAANAAQGRVIVIGSSLSFSDAVMPQLRQFYNANLLSNCVNWLGDQGDLVSIEPKDMTPEALPVTDKHATLLQLICWVQFPLLAIALGIYVYLKRR